MPTYLQINPQEAEGKRTLERLLSLREHLDQEIPPRNLDKSILLATWNIREFDSNVYGERTPESFQYIAEIISRFDIVAIQEVRRNLKALDNLIEILGKHWRYIFTDATEGQKGNNERMAFVYDSRKIQFGGLAGELVLPPIKIKKGKRRVLQPVSQLARTPFICGFKSGWTTFILATVHIVYGESKRNDPDRVEEIKQLSSFLRQRADAPDAWSKNLIILGDFNIFSPEDITMQQLTESGFIIPPELQNLPSNVQKNKHYDQIAYRARKGRFGTTGKAGVFDFFTTVFAEKDEKAYANLMGKKYNDKDAKGRTSYYMDYWRTHQMSDHLPMWVELKVDYSDHYIRSKLASLNGEEFEDVKEQSDWSRDIFSPTEGSTLG